MPREIHFGDNFPAERGESAVAGRLAGGVGPVVGVGPGEGHVTDAEIVESAEALEGVFDGVAALEPEQDAELSRGAGGEDVSGGEAEGEVGRVSADLLVDGFDEGEGAVGEMAGELVGLDPDGKELGGQVAATGGV